MSSQPDSSPTPNTDDPDDIVQEIVRKRSLRGSAAIVVAIIGIAFSAFQMWIAARGYTFAFKIPVTGIEYTIIDLQQLQVNAIHVCFGLILAFLLYPPSTGDGVVARRLGRTTSVMKTQLGPDQLLARIITRIGHTVRWAAVDEDMTRVTPVDIVLIGVTVQIGYYMLIEFEEIRQIRAVGLGSVRTVDEVYPVLDPIVSVFVAAGVPLDDRSFAFLIGLSATLLVLEATRRVLGVFLTVLVSLFIVYARWGYLIPRDATYVGVLSIPPLGWDSIIRDFWFNTQAGILGVPVMVSVRFVYIFILFGAFLEMSGAGKWFIDFAYSLTGTKRGGPAKASVVASGFMGMLSGSSVANTVTTGAFTIPLMKRSGYTPEFAGAVESSASSGGQILPPVMGAAAFLIVEFTLTPYAEVILAAAIPALAFFYGMWVIVHFEASKHNIGGLDRADLPNARDLIGNGWFYLVPIFLLLYLLVGVRLTVSRSAWYTIIAVIALIAFISAYNDRTRGPLIGTIGALFLTELAAYLIAGVGITDVLMGVTGSDIGTNEALFAAAGSLSTITIIVSVAVLLLRPTLESPVFTPHEDVDRTAEMVADYTDRPSLATNQFNRFSVFILKSMESGARTATTVVIAVAAAGVIPGVISVSGLGPNLTSLVLTVSGGSLIILLLVTGISAIILGLGMPTTVMYIILVSMLGPAIEEFGFAILAAHLFILYFGLMADVTPPVAVAAYAAAGVAKADEFETGVLAFLLSLNKILVPFAFIFSPGILLLREGEEGMRMIGISDVLDISYFVSDIIIPIIGLFVGVYALGITIIGYYHTKVSPSERAVLAFSSIAVMAPALLYLSIEGIVSLLGVSVILNDPIVDMALRGIGAILFAGFVIKNKRASKRESPESTPQQA